MGLYVQLVKHDRTGELYIMLRDEEAEGVERFAASLHCSPLDWRPCVTNLSKGVTSVKGDRFTIIRNVFLQHTDD
jgi:hypothetical protein